ncbi:MAG: SdpI family protein [Blastocatellia bacterium]
MYLGIVGAVFILVGLPFFFEMVKPNWISGFRLRKTLSNPRIWYAANRVMGRDFIVAGIVLLSVAVVLLALNQVMPHQLHVHKIEMPLILSSLFAVSVHCLWRLAKM